MTSSGALTTLVHFNGTNGAYPNGKLLQASDGALYGTTSMGGQNDRGTVYKYNIGSGVLNIIGTF
ncbi:MAG: hypothetical protein RLZZ69_1639, partial [Cyanobacteriota bacterium]